MSTQCLNEGDVLPASASGREGYGAGQVEGGRVGVGRIGVGRVEVRSAQAHAHAHPHANADMQMADLFAHRLHSCHPGPAVRGNECVVRRTMRTLRW